VHATVPDDALAMDWDSARETGPVWFSKDSSTGTVALVHADGVQPPE
jgi:hypothetical protein